MIKLVVFDCDGVLFDSREANRRYYNYLLEEFGHPPMSEEELDFVHSHSAGDSARHIFRAYPDELEKVNAFRLQADYSPFLRHMIMEPGLIEFLTLLRKSCKTAISTNRTTTMPEVMDIFGLHAHFDMVVTALDVNNPKPHPEALLHILEHFGFVAGDAIYFGDSIVDQEHAAAAGVPLIAFRSPGLKAAYHVNSFKEAARLPVFDGLAPLAAHG